MKAKQKRRLTYVKALVTFGIIVLIGCSQKASAQWATNGNNINNTNSGNVGVGTSNPNRAKLEISKDSGFNMAGGIEINAAGVDTGLALGADATNNIGWIQSLEPGISFTTRPLALQPNGGNVGIGTSSPIYSFDVNGGVNAFRSKTSTASANDTIATFENSNGIQAIMRANGNFGLGTVSPSVLMDLKGNNVSYGGQLRLQSTDYSQITFYNSNNPTLNAANRLGSMYYDIANSRLHIDNQAGAKYLVLNWESGGNVGIGTASPTAKLHVAGNVTVDGNIAAKYQDVAEWVPAAGALAPGTVVTLHPTQSNLVEASSKAYDTGVAGVISAQPGITLGERSENKVLVATTGRVRVKVDATYAPIHIGDLLVTSDTPGMAMKSEPIAIGGRKIHSPGTLIGKALEPLAKGQAEILVLLSLQ